jgi:segregation and condensation protein B
MDIQNQPDAEVEVEAPEGLLADSEPAAPDAPEAPEAGPTPAAPEAAPEGAPDRDEPEEPVDAEAPGESGEVAEVAETSQARRQRPPDAPDVPEPEDLPELLEALLFVSEEPVDLPSLVRALGHSRRHIDASLEQLADSLRDSERGLRLQRGPQGVALVTAPAAAPHVEYFLGLESTRRLSPAALETLAIVAYRQPVTRGTIELIRGVSADASLATLRARGLVEERGRADTPGRPVLWATTQRFLQHFGLERPDQLPPLPDDIDLPHEEAAQLSLEELDVGEELQALSQVAGHALAASDAADEDAGVTSDDEPGAPAVAEEAGGTADEPDLDDWMEPPLATEPDSLATEGPSEEPDQSTLAAGDPAFRESEEEPDDAAMSDDGAIERSDADRA